jgi:hypothetical protein
MIISAGRGLAERKKEGEQIARVEPWQAMACHGRICHAMGRMHKQDNSEASYKDLCFSQAVWLQPKGHERVRVHTQQPTAIKSPPAQCHFEQP